MCISGLRNCVPSRAVWSVACGKQESAVEGWCYVSDPVGVPSQCFDAVSCRYVPIFSASCPRGGYEEVARCRGACSARRDEADAETECRVLVNVLCSCVVRGVQSLIVRSLEHDARSVPPRGPPVNLHLVLLSCDPFNCAF